MKRMDRGGFLEAEMPKDGRVVLGFNKAYNPYCAFNPYSSCPIPPKENKLITRIEARGKAFGRAALTKAARS